jgi:SAM-dependent methyltransferase
METNTPNVIPINPFPLRLDIGCGKSKRGPTLIEDPNGATTDPSGKRFRSEPWTGVDSISFPGVDVVCNLSEREGSIGPFKRWPFEDSSVEEIHSSHCIEHFDRIERVHVINEFYRILKPGCKATMIAPHWASGRAYGDPTHQWPPVAEFASYYWDKNWRDLNAPHDDIKWNPFGYNCHFHATWAYCLHNEIIPKNQEYQMFALTFYKEAAQDIVFTLTALK